MPPKQVKQSFGMNFLPSNHNEIMKYFKTTFVLILGLAFIYSCKDERAITKKEVAKFLNVSERTINNYIERGLLKEGIHFHKKNNAKMLVFIESAVFEFRDDLLRGLA